MEASKNPLISVITVCYNNATGLEETILSVLSQAYSNLEFIIVDGGSTDKTLEVLNKYKDRVDSIISEPDQGIYDAMNKGIEIASGDWVIFMNSGDNFFSSTSISEVFGENNWWDFDVIYGNWEVRYPSGKRRKVHAGRASNLWKGSQFCHQAAFISSQTHKTSKYNLDNPIAADFEFFYGLQKNGGSFRRTNNFIASIDAGGVSDLKRLEVIEAWRKTVGSNLKSNLYFSFRRVREFIVQHLKRMRL